METTPIHVRIETTTYLFLKKQANIQGRTLSGMINKYLSDEKNRTESRERKEVKNG